MLKDLIYFFVNRLLNKIPSRTIRINIYHFLSRGNISRKASIGLDVKMLDIRHITIGDYTNINDGCIIDGRGEGIEISSNVDIAPQVNIWSLEHDPNSPTYEARSGKVFIGRNAWLANRAIILPGVTINEFAVIGAGCVISSICESSTIYVGARQREIKKRDLSVKNYTLRKIRRFR